MPSGSPVVVVVAFHAADLLAEALGPLRDLDLVVVDNSSDPAVAAVAREAGADYLDPGRNLGFGAAVNLGVGHVAAREAHRDVLLLNPDAVLSAQAVEDLQVALQADPRLAAVAPRLLDDSGTEQRVAWPWPSPAGMWREALGLRRRPPSDTWLVGAVLLLRAAALQEVGGFDETFFLYAEETDWQRRATMAGWQVRQVDAVTARHVGGGTSSVWRHRECLFHAGTERYVRKWSGSAGWASYRTAALVGAAIRGVLLRGAAGKRARHRAQLYLRGPLRVARRRGLLSVSP